VGCTLHPSDFLEMERGSPKPMIHMMAAPAAVLQHRPSPAETLLKKYSTALKFTAHTGGKKTTVLDPDIALHIRDRMIAQFTSTTEPIINPDRILVEKPSMRSPAVLCIHEDAFTTKAHHEEAMKFLSELAGEAGLKFTASAFSSRPPQHPVTKLFVIRKNTRTSFREIADYIATVSGIVFPDDAIQQHPTVSFYAYLLCPNERLKDKALADLGVENGKASVTLNGGRHIVQSAWTHSSKAQPQRQQQLQNPPSMIQQQRCELTTPTAATTPEPQQQQQDKATTTPPPNGLTAEEVAKMINDSMSTMQAAVITAVQNVMEQQSAGQPYTIIKEIGDMVGALAQHTTMQLSGLSTELSATVREGKETRAEVQRLSQKMAGLEREISQLKKKTEEKTKAAPEGLKRDMVVLGEKFTATIHKMDTVLTTDKRNQERIANLESRISKIEASMAKFEHGIYAITQGLMALEELVEDTRQLGIATDKNGE